MTATTQETARNYDAALDSPSRKKLHGFIATASTMVEKLRADNKNLLSEIEKMNISIKDFHNAWNEYTNNAATADFLQSVIDDANTNGLKLAENKLRYHCHAINLKANVFDDKHPFVLGSNTMIAERAEALIKEFFDI